MSSVTIKKELPSELLSDILITAFDGSYGWSWNWFESIERNDIGDGSDWMELGHGPYCNLSKSHPARTDRCICEPRDPMRPWLKVGCRLKFDYHTGNGVFDNPDGFTVTHDLLAQAIGRIVNDDYLGLWRSATPAEKHKIMTTDNLYGRAFKEEEPGEWLVETGESARGYREALAAIVANPEDADIDACFADAIVQVAIFGKCIFS